jgi:hypothetical protein
VAAAKGRVKVEGVREVQRALKAFDAKTEDLKAVHTTVARTLLPGIASRTPRRTGELAGSWDAGATKTRARLLSSRPYAGPIEYGWTARGIEPARMVRATIEAEQGEIVERYEDELEKLADRIGFDTP